MARQNRFLLLIAALWIMSTGAASAEEGVSTDKLGTKIEHVVFQDAAGKRVDLDDMKDKSVIVVVFLSFDCPVSTSYAAPLAEMARKYESRGVAFFAASTNSEEDVAQLAKHAAEFKIPFPVFRDSGLRAADAFTVLSKQHGAKNPWY